MIGMFSPVSGGKRPVLALWPVFSELGLYFSTEACIDEGAGAYAYPRTASVYTIRTPSPDGQRGVCLPTLPVSLWGGRICGSVSVRRRMQKPLSSQKQENNLRGFRACRSKHLRLSWRRVSALRPVAIQSVNRPSEGLPSAPARRSSRTTVSFRGRRWVRGPMCSSASSAPASVTRPDTHSQGPLRRPRKSALRGPLSCLGSTRKHPSCYRKTSHVQ